MIIKYLSTSKAQFSVCSRNSNRAASQRWGNTTSAATGPQEGPKILRGNTNNVVGIICSPPLVEIGLTDLSKSGGYRPSRLQQPNANIATARRRSNRRRRARRAAAFKCFFSSPVVRQRVTLTSLFPPVHSTQIFRWVMELTVTADWE